MDLLRLKKVKGKKLGVKGITVFILTAVTGSLAHIADSNAQPKAAIGSAPH